MSGICGWLNLKNPDASEAEILSQMMYPLKVADAQDSLVLTPQASTAAVPLHANGSALQEGSLLISYTGRARWTSSELNHLSEKEGMCKAIAMAYQTDGKDFLQKLTGPFSLAIIDVNENSVLGAIDRIGVHPLCFSQNEQVIVFGASANSVTAHPSVTATVNPQGIFNYLYFHMVPSPGTIFENIEKLLPGQYFYAKNGKVEKEFYWNLEYQDSNSKSESELVSECMQSLRNAMARNANKENTGAFLSGGTDSSTMAGLLSEYLGKGAETFSIGFDAEGFDETEFANITVKHFGTKHHEYRVTPNDVADTIPLIAKTYDEPFGNASAVPTYFCAKLAKEHGIDIMIAGDGGDEVFAGNERYAKQQIFEHYYKVPKVIRGALIEPVALNFPGAQSIMPMRKLQSYIKQARIPLPARLETYNFLNRTGLNEIFTPDFLATVDTQDPLSISKDAYDRTHSNSIVNKMMHLDLKNTLADNDLRKVNKMCEAADVEVRYPLLDEEVVAFAATVPPDLQIKDGKLRYFFKYAMKDFLADETLTKSKHGFGLPFGLWLKENPRLQEIAQSSLNSIVKRGFIQESYIKQLNQLHQSEHASYYGVMVWIIIVLEQWMDVNGV